MTEGPYKLPEGWRWVRLGEVAYKPQYGYTASATFEPVGPKFIRITDITSGDIAWDNVPHCRCNSKALEKYRIYPGDILFARTGSVGATILIREVRHEAVFASYLIRVRLREEVLPEYADWVLRSPVCQNQLIAQGAAQKNINAQLITQILIPLPPLAEQRRIVARIEELMSRVREARRLRQEARQDAEHLWQSVLAQTFPRPGSDLPEGWRWVRLGEVCEYERRTIDPSRFPNHEFLVYSIPAYDNNKQPEVLKGSAIGSAKLVIHPNVCLFSKLNPRIPRAWIVKKDIVNSENPLLASTEFMPLRPRSEMLDVDYLGIVLLTSTFLDQVRTDVTGATGSRQRLKPENVLDALIPLPPLDEQRRIVSELEAVREKLQALKKAQDETDEELKRLEQAILERAFRGEL